MATQDHIMPPTPSPAEAHYLLSRLISGADIIAPADGGGAFLLVEVNNDVLRQLEALDADDIYGEDGAETDEDPDQEDDDPAGDPLDRGEWGIDDEGEPDVERGPEPDAVSVPPFHAFGGMHGIAPSVSIMEIDPRHFVPVGDDASTRAKAVAEVRR